MLASALALALCLAPIAAGAQDSSAAKPAGNPHADLAEVVRKLANPVSDLWALFSEFDFTFNGGDARVGKLPVRFQLGVEYSVVSQDFFGKRAMSKLNIIPLIPDLIEKPLF